MTSIFPLSSRDREVAFIDNNELFHKPAKNHFLCCVMLHATSFFLNLFIKKYFLFFLNSKANCFKSRENTIYILKELSIFPIVIILA